MIPSIVANNWQTTLLEYLDTVFPFRDERLTSAFLDFLRDEEDGLFRGPYVHAQIPFRQANANEPSPLTVFRPPFTPYVHQLNAFRRLVSTSPDGPQPTLVTTGTGSGKTEAFLYPIIDHCIRQRRAGQEGIKAIILYPMNALAQDQAKRLAKLIFDDETARRTLTAGLYVGAGEGRAAGGTNVSKAMTSDRLIEDRSLLRKFPPDILLTNYKMLDLLLLRKVDWPLWAKNKPATLRYLVLDELHSYDGVQSADLACLIRRLSSRLHIPSGILCPVGTSATLGDNGSDAKAGLRKYAGTVFGIQFPDESIIQEDRPDLGEFLLPLSSDAIPDQVGEFWPLQNEDVDTYSTRQSELWFSGDADLTAALRGHAWFHHLCRKATKEPLTWKRLVDSFEQEFTLDPDISEGLVQSFLVVVSTAKWVDGHRPLLPVQVQLWIRELRGVGRIVAEDPKFIWTHREDDLGEAIHAGFVTHPLHEVHTDSDLASATALPVIVCRNCGASGWVALRNPAEPHKLVTDTSTIVSMFGNAEDLSVAEKERILYLYPLTESTPVNGFVNDNQGEPRYLTRGGNLLKQSIDNSIRVNVVQPYIDSQLHLGVSSLHHYTCPHCQQREALGVVSMRRASIGAVLASNVLGSDHVLDPKVLSFVDSVQDSALLAGFIQHRAKNGLMRTALVKKLQGSESVATLDDAVNRWPNEWREEMSNKGFLRTFVDNEETDERVADRYPRNLEDWSEQTWQGAMDYVSTRVLQEFTLHARLIRSRSLYQTGVAVLRPEYERLTRAVQDAMVTINERHHHLATDGHLKERLMGLTHGLIHRMMLEGGVSHGVLESFRSGGGRPYLLSRDQNPDYPGSRRIPTFFTTGQRSKDGLASIFGPDNSWLALYVTASLAPSIDGGFDATNFGQRVDHGDVLHTLLNDMRESGLVDVIMHGSDQTFGLKPSGLLVERQTTRLVCKKCRSEITVATQDSESFIAHTPCLVYRCGGSYEKATPRSRRYSQRLYEESRVLAPIVKEHSSLVTNEDRRKFERRFETGKPEPLNVLICTPTMEMGIDIGDLSTVLLTGVPPTLANRVQRIGRAGRSTGKALIAQIVREQPHDQYFWESPRELLAGRIEPPSCPLDAPQVLRRHLRAFLLDAWIRDRPEAGIPAKASRVVLEAASAQGFPELFFAYVEANRDALWKEFESRFLDGLAKETVQDVQDYFGEGDWIRETEKVISVRREEEREARRHLERLNRRLQEQEFQAQEAQRSEEYRDLERTVYQARARHRSLLQEDTTEWWTNEGLLPNYTFPEHPVTLRRYRGQGLIEEFQRGQREALRELAPGRVFYARGHRSPVSQISLGRYEQGLERWRLCSVCQHMEPELEATEGPCPNCGTPEWQDTGRVLNMVRLHRVSARDTARDEKITDNEEERQRTGSIIEMFFEFPGAAIGVGQMRTQPFGFELFPTATIREINFGAPDTDEGERRVAGITVPKGGFTICSECGAVGLRDRRGNLQIRHVRGYACDRARVRDLSAQVVNQGTNERRNAAEDKRTQVYVYREFASEVLRFPLPVGEALREERLANWMAAIQLGLREHLGGSARQIAISTYDEPLEGDSNARARYLVLYDTVPGGTGYLRQLAQPGEIHMLLEKALHVLQHCECQHDGRRACYRCLLRYESQFQHPLLSRRLAVELVKPLVDAGEADWEILGELDIAAVARRPELSESDLEVLMEERLRERLNSYGGGTQAGFTPLNRGNRRGWRIKIQRPNGEVVWEMVRQGALNHDDALFSTRPDWIITPVMDPASARTSRESDDFMTDAAGIKPVAVFCDGQEYHIGQNEHDRFPRDILQREAIRRSARYVVISVTRKDLSIEQREQLSDPYPMFLAGLSNVAQRMGVSLLPSLLWESNGLELLCNYLVWPEVGQWEALAKALGLSLCVGAQPRIETSLDSAADVLDQAYVADTKAPYVTDNVAGAPTQVVVKEYVFGSAADLSLTLTATTVQSSYHIHGVVRLNDDGETRDGSGFVPLWGKFLQYLNILQWLPNVRFTSTRSLLRYREEWRQLDLLRPVYGLRNILGGRTVEKSPEWIGLVTEEFTEVAIALADAGVPEPEVGYEFMKEGAVIGEAELAWPEEKVAMFRPDVDEEVRATVRQLAWKLWDPDAVREVVEDKTQILNQWAELIEGSDL